VVLIFSDYHFKTNFTGRIIFAILSAYLILIAPSPASAQNNTLYLMHSIPQSNQLNPALKGPCRIYISLPVISSFRLSIRNTGFGFNDVFYTGTGDQSDNYYLDIDKLDRNLRRMDYSLVNTDVDLLGFGFPVRDWYFTFGISSHISMLASYPHDIVLLADENWDVNSGLISPVRINNLKLNSSAWNSFGISASKEIREGLRVGVRLKYLNGMANVSTGKSEIGLNTTTNPGTLQANFNYRVNSSLPVDIALGSNGMLNSISINPAKHNLAGNYLFNGNRGISIDAGLTYDIDEVTQVSASITDLGFIRWKKNLNSFTESETFVFTETELNQIIINPESDNLITSLLDSIRNSVNVSPSPAKYFTATPVNLYGGITREVLPNLKAGAMTWIEINSTQVRPSLTLSMNYSPFKEFAATVSYTLMNNKFNQIGAGLEFGNKNVRFYILTENIPLRYTKVVKNSATLPDQAPKTDMILPYNARMLTLRFGMNLFFGCDKKDKKKNGSSGNTHNRSKTSTKDECRAYW
jgi:hypothetical protein